jgi:hypothetical protein
VVEFSTAALNTEQCHEILRKTVPLGLKAQLAELEHRIKDIIRQARPKKLSS